MPRPAEPARQTLRRARAQSGCAAPADRPERRHVVPRRLRRPRHDVRLIHV